MGSLIPAKGSDVKKLDYIRILELCTAAETAQADDLDRLSLVRDLASDLRTLSRGYIQDLHAGDTRLKKSIADKAERGARLQVKNKLRAVELKERMEALKAAATQTENLFNTIEQVQDGNETTDKRLDRIEKAMDDALEQLAGKKRKAEEINT